MRSTGPSKPSTHLQTFYRQKMMKSTLREYATVSWLNSPTTRTGRVLQATLRRKVQGGYEDNDAIIVQRRTDPTGGHHRIHETIVRAARADAETWRRHREHESTAERSSKRIH